MKVTMYGTKLKRLMSRYFKQLSFVTVRGKLIFALIGLIYFAATPAIANIVAENASPNYLVVMVHGLISDRSAFDKLKTFLEDQLGLKGYVYAYNFDANRGSIVDQGRELGDRSYLNPSPEMGGLCWLEKAKVDFVSHNPGKPVPRKVILVCHSMGGSRDNVHRIALSGIW
jgi:triacylglycerol esterase/lipase EstA (alpha/beta hydrolase family)